MKESWKEYKERKEAQNYFRQNNDQFLSSQQWIKTILSCLVGALFLGVVHGAITMGIGIDFSILYIVIGYAFANIATSVSGVSSHQVALVSAVMTFLAFFISRLTVYVIVYSTFGISLSVIINMIPMTFMSMFQSGILDLIFIVIGVFVAYQQAQ